MIVEEKKSVGWRLAPVAVFLTIALFFVNALFSSDPSKLPSALLGKQVPVTEFPAIADLVSDNQPVPGFKSADLADGKIKLVNFWASWCASCVEEHPLLIETKQKTGVELFGVNNKDQPESARRFLGRFGNPFTAVGTDSNGRSAIEWGVYGMPETFVVNGRGEIVYKHVGPVTRESLERLLLPAIEKAKSSSAAAR